jgi:hypothetical protein
MNEFTKEELQIILLDMDTYIEKSTILKESPSHGQLRSKINNMIDTYCEHNKTKQCNISEQVLCTDCGEEIH